MTAPVDPPVLSALPRKGKRGAGRVGSGLPRVDAGRGRGRPRIERWFTVAEVAHLLEHSVLRVKRALELAPASFFPHSARDADGVLLVPERDLTPLLGAGLEPMMRLQTFARLFDVPRATVGKWVKSGAVKGVLVLGMMTRIPASEYWRLRARPGSRGPAPSFFSEEGLA